MNDLNRRAKSNRYFLIPILDMSNLTNYNKLLAALKQPPAGAPPPVAVASAAIPSGPGMPQVPPLPSSNTYYPPAPPVTSYVADISNPYGPTAVPPPAAAISTTQALNPALAGLPPNILSMLHAQQPQSRAPIAPSQLPYSVPPTGASPAGSLPPSNPQYQQLMAYLVRVSIHCNVNVSMVVVAIPRPASNWQVTLRLSSIKKNKIHRTSSYFYLPSTNIKICHFFIYHSWIENTCPQEI